MADWTSSSEKTTTELVIEAGLALSVLAQIGLVFESGVGILWPWLAGGVLAGIVFIAGARTDTGQRFDDWWGRIGLSGRFVAIMAMLLALFLWIWFAEPPRAPYLSLTVGLLGVLLLSIVGQFVEIVRKRLGRSERETLGS